MRVALHCHPRLWGLALGLTWLACLTLRSLAGEPIIFSSPTKEVKLPPEEERPVKTPTVREWRRVEPEVPFYLAPPEQPRNPLVDKRMKELLEEKKKNWLEAEPRVFRDPFEDPLSSRASRLQRSGFTALEAWDKKAERVLGTSEARGVEWGGERNALDKPGRSDSEAENQRDAMGMNGPERRGKSPRNTEDSERRQEDSKERDGRETEGKSGNDPQQIMKALFEMRSGDKSQKITLVPGMSIYEAMEASSRAAERAREERRHDPDRAQEPRRVLTVMPGLTPELFDLTREDASRAGPLKEDPLKLMSDPTARPLRPVVAGTGGLMEPAESGPFRALAPPAAGRLTPPKAKDLEVLPGAQTSVPTPKPQTREGQLESIKLMHRPSVLPFPGRFN